ncbi:2-hydroxyacid dehydrogenase [Roseomonas sp. 18066]|uniref:2-hydroxyacid dehydrogenase n=1 Tax=Roseomonas sp. 18066 TaxID=2681412 RepID=UPI001357919F|nr:2-hydroxyacid dehydrogenase [Roseomonas sp. 18066]
MSENLHRILYLSHAPEAVYAMWRARLPEGCELLTLSSNDDAERLAKLAEADAVIVAPHVLRPEWVALAPRLKLVQHQGVGWQGETPIAELRARGIRLAINPSGTADVVSEHALALMLACLKHIPRADAAMRRGEWLGTALRTVSRNLRGRTVGIVGMGRIGSAVAALLQPFRVRGLYVDPYQKLPEGLELALGFRRVDLPELLRESEVVTLHLPATPETHHLFDDAAFAAMRRDAVLINCARGPVLDEAALARALKSGAIRSAGIDVFDPEPPRPDNPLFGLDNVVLTPHVAAGTFDAMQAKVEGATANLGRFFRGEALQDEIDLTAC